MSTTPLPKKQEYTLWFHRGQGSRAGSKPAAPISNRQRELLRALQELPRQLTNGAETLSVISARTGEGFESYDAIRDELMAIFAQLCAPLLRQSASQAYIPNLNRQVLELMLLVERLASDASDGHADKL